jgi:hypothetical protein
MQITYLNPLFKAWDRMKKALFQPFDIRRWFVVGFTAFLAGLIRGGPSTNFSGGRNREIAGLPDIHEWPGRVMDWIHVHPIIFVLILCAVVLAIILALVLTWLASRGTFMFLDNVVADRALVVAPWRQYKSLGNSLFLWRVGFGFVCFFVTLPLVILGFLTFLPFAQGHAPERYLLSFLGILAAGLLLFIVVMYISMLTNNFVVPIMYKHNLRAMAAWGAFMPLLANHLLHFILYGLFLLVLIIVTGIAILVTGCFTCCLLFLILLIPYIGSVVLLPVTYAYRAFSLEFLAQFGPDYDLFPAPPPPSPPLPPSPEPLKPESPAPDPNPAPAQ